MASERQGGPERANPPTDGSAGRDTRGASRVATGTGTCREGTCAGVLQVAGVG